jgi:hypothetical protein
MQVITAIPWGQYRSGEYLISIELRSGIALRMKIGGCRDDAKDPDVLRKQAIGSLAPSIERERQAAMEIGYLPAGVHSGIGTPGTSEFDRMACDSFEGVLKESLYRRKARLDLPSGIMGSVVLQQHFEILDGHRRMKEITAAKTASKAGSGEQYVLQA